MGEDVSKVSEERLREGAEKLGREILKIEHELWSGSHCRDSEWQQGMLPLKQARLEDQIGACGDEADARPEATGLSNLLAANVVTWERARMEALRREYTLKGAVAGLVSRMRKGGFLPGATMYAMDWEWELDQAIGLLKEHLRKDEIQTVHSGRPWSIEIAGKLQATVQDGWKVRLGQSFVFFLTAVLPVRKRILASFCSSPSTKQNLLVTMFTSLDLTCLVTTWVLCAVAPAAYHLGDLFETTISELGPLAEGVINRIDLKSKNKHVAYDIYGALLTLGPKVAEMAWNLVPALAWSWHFFLELVIGSLCFFAVSTAFARWLSPQTGFATHVSVGVCGPLWLFTEESEHKGIMGLNAYFAIVLRSLSLAAFVVWSWTSVNDYSVQLFFAITCKSYLSKDGLIWSWIGLLVVHFLCGFATVSALGSADDSTSEDGSDEEQGLEASATASYRTFAITSKKAQAHK
ncbi:unnamed protein product [Symbiodinium sp. CCMP2456]|nr:unnamed protein product [Symbiodinium sp. CCMP2456]